MKSFGQLYPIPELGDSEVPHMVKGTKRLGHLDKEETAPHTLPLL